MLPDRLTIVALHAHPDDETLLTGGTLARAVREGHRVVVVTCTDGAAGLSADDSGLAERRAQEAAQAVRTLGCQRWVGLGYPDSGSHPDRALPGSFATLDPAEPAARVEALLQEERADLLISYDENGGYGHPDHVQVHRVGALAAALAGTPVVWEATVDATLMRRLLQVLARVPFARELVPPGSNTRGFSGDIDHVIDVRTDVKRKQEALRAHRSQMSGASLRAVGLLARLPQPLAGVVLGREWFRTAFPVPEENPSAGQPHHKRRGSRRPIKDHVAADAQGDAPGQGKTQARS